MNNLDFLRALFEPLSAHERPLFCSFSGDPLEHGDWSGRPLQGDPPALSRATSNNFFCVSAFLPDSTGRYACRIAQFSSLRCVMVDDVTDPATLALPPAWIIETSPGNYQAGYKLTLPILDRTLAQRFVAAISRAVQNLGGNNVTRWARLPVGSNGKSKYGPGGFPHRLTWFSPERTYDWQQMAQAFRAGPISVLTRPAALALDPTYMSDAVPALMKLGLYRRPLGAGRHSITCPNRAEHTDGAQGNSDTVYFEPSAENGFRGGMKCLHSHCEHVNLDLLLILIQMARALDIHDVYDARGRVVDRVATRRTGREARGAAHNKLQQATSTDGQ